MRPARAPIPTTACREPRRAIALLGGAPLNAFSVAIATPTALCDRLFET
ncbi:MAG: hypothetical protein GY772_09530 [bacterium]|nr:hypothetical protein [bacterium]